MKLNIPQALKLRWKKRETESEKKNSNSNLQDEGRQTVGQKNAKYLNFSRDEEEDDGPL
jgi:hypothetical protein